MNMNDIYEYLKKKHVGEENAVFSKEPENYLCSFRWFWDFVASSAPNRSHFSVRSRSCHRTEAVPDFPLFEKTFSVLSCSFG